MRLSLRSTLAAALLPAAVLLTACGTSPLEPTVPATTAAQPQHLSGYTVSWGKDKPQPQNLSGYTVSWGRDGQPTRPQTLSGYTVSWGKDKPQPQTLSGYTVGWGKNGN